MKKQKLVSFLLVAALMLPLCTTVFAAGDTTTDTEISTVTSDGTEIQIPSVLNIPTIKVTIGAPSVVCVNPYKMHYTHPVAGDQTTSVISSPTWIKSNSTLKMDVTAKPTVTVQGGILVSATDFAESITGDKKIFLQLYMDKVSGVGSAGKTAALAYTTTGASTPAVITESGANTVTMTMDAAADGTDDKATYGAFLIGGHSAGANWSQITDKLTVTVVFNINPVIGT